MAADPNTTPELDVDAATGCADDALPGTAEQWRAAADAIAPYVIQGECKWPGEHPWSGPRSHPYGIEAYSVLEPNSEPPRIRIYPNREAALPYIQECGYEIGA